MVESEYGSVLASGGLVASPSSSFVRRHRSLMLIATTVTLVCAAIAVIAMVNEQPFEDEQDPIALKTKVIIIRESVLRKKMGLSPRYARSDYSDDSDDAAITKYADDDTSSLSSSSSSSPSSSSSSLSWPNINGNAGLSRQTLARLERRYSLAQKQAKHAHAAPKEGDYQADPYDSLYSYPTSGLANAGDLWRNPGNGDCGFGSNC